MGTVIRLHKTSAEKVIENLPAPDDLEEIIIICRAKCGGTSFSMSDMKIETLAYYIAELQREYNKIQEQGGF